jgi:predicted site-specific integrase-resolvase
MDPDTRELDAQIRIAQMVRQPLLNVTQAAARIGVTPRSLHNYVTNGRLRVVERRGQSPMFAPEDVDVFIASRRSR